MPHPYSATKMISPLCLNVGRRTISPYFRTSILGPFQISYHLVFMIARMQDRNNAEMSESVTACRETILNSWRSVWKNIRKMELPPD